MIYLLCLNGTSSSHSAAHELLRMIGPHPPADTRILLTYFYEDVPDAKVEIDLNEVRDFIIGTPVNPHLNVLCDVQMKVNSFFLTW